jgi:signal transduction histidine kinase/ActR/RegA family two-component response regulator
LKRAAAAAERERTSTVIHPRVESVRLAGFACLFALLAGCANEPPAAIATLRSAQVVGDSPASRTVTLPLVREADAVPPSGRLAYHFDVDVTRPDSGLGVFVTVSTAPFAAYVNGNPVFQNGDVRSSPIATGSYRASPFFRVAPSLLKSGTNKLVLQTFERRRYTALGPVLVGPPDAVERWAMREGLLHHALPVLIGAALLGVGIIALALWRGRKDSVLFLLLACGTLLWGTQQLLQQLPSPPLPAPHFEVLMISLYIWYAMLLAVFFMRFAYHLSPAFERVAALLAAIAAPAFYIGAETGYSELASRGIRIAALVLIVIALVAVVRYAWRERGGKSLLLVAAGALCVGFAWRDYIVSLGESSGRSLWLTSYSGIALIAIAGWILVERYHRAYAASEASNVELESRVRAASAEISRRLEQVQAAREQAEQASVAKSRFFAAASHDLRQPLHSLGLNAAALDAHVTSREARELVARIGESIDALEGLFNELLDLSRLDAGAVAVAPRNIALQAVFDRLSFAFHAEAVARNLRMRFVPTALAVRTDPVLLERILSNLVSNALRYTIEGGTVIGARARGSEVWIDVVDTGIGIAPDKQQQVFDEFFQVGNPGRDRRRGLGLGLSIVKRLVALLGHDLSLVSRPGRGTRFRLVLPRAAAADRVPARTVNPGLEPFVGRHVLLVDDDPDIRAATVQLLGQWGLTATACAGRSDVEAFVSLGVAPDIALVDLRLDAVDDGIDVIELLRHRLRPDLPALLLSGDTGAAELARVRSSGVPLLTKPVAPARLKSALHAYLSRYRGAGASVARSA